MERNADKVRDCLHERRIAEKPDGHAMIPADIEIIEGCERCGAEDELQWREGQDPAVGYREEAWLCGKCSGGTL